MNITLRVQAARAKREIEYLRAQVRTLETALGRAGATGGTMFNGGLAGLSRWGSGMQWAGRQLSANFTLPVLAAGGAIAKWALDSEAALVQIKKVYGDASGGANAFLAVQDQMIQAFDLLSEHYGVQQVEVRNIAAEWAAAGASGAALARGTEATLKTMTLGQMDATAATEALISIQAQWGTSTEGLLDIINKMNATENATGITFQGLVEGMQRSSSVARTAGLDVEHLVAMLAALTPATGTAAQSGNALKTMISRLLAPTEDARDILQAMGLRLEDTAWNSLNAAERLELLAEKYHTLEGATESAVDSQGNYISSQAGVVSAYIASRYQINRFDQLMRDVYASMDDNADTNGYYGRTLDILADDAQVARIAFQELNAVLESDPMLMQRAGVMIQNSLMKVIQNILPQIIWFAQTVADLTRKFSELDPRIQKAVLAVLALLAILGPPLVILGSLAVAVSRVGTIFQWLATPLTFITGMFKKSEGGPRGYMVALSGFIGKVRAAFASVAGTIATATPANNAAATASGASTGAAYSAATAGAVQAGTLAIAASGATGAATAGATSAFVYTTVTASGIRVGAPNIFVAMRNLWTSSAFISASGAGGAAAATGFFGRLLAGVKNLGPRLITFVKGLWPLILQFIKKWGLQLVKLFTGPWGWAISGAITLLLMFKDQIGQFFSNIVKQAQDATSPLGKAWTGIVEIARKAFNLLPESVQGALKAVVGMVKTAAMKVYEWFSYINPFARHSPSLVENVTNGMNIVGERFGLAADVIKGHMTNAYQLISKFGKATAGFMSQVQSMAAAEERAKVAKFTPGALAYYDQLNKALPPLRNDLEDVAMAMAKQDAIVTRLKGALDAQQRSVDALQKTYDKLENNLNSIQAQMDAAQQKIDEYSNVGITGQRAMSDAIFENEMAQKRLRLEILRLEQAGGSVDDLRSRLASLQGDIESLRKDANDLRAAGAGSDILGPINAQIAAMEAQYKALSNGAGAGAGTVDALQKQLEELQKQGEILDLENAINFDPLERQIDQLTDNYKEMPFDQIVDGIREQQEELARLQPQYDAANTALQQQQVLLDAAKVKLDLANDSYNEQRDILDGLNTTYQAVEDQIRNVEEAIRSVTGATDDMQRALDDGARKAKETSEYISPAMQNFLDAAGGSFEDQGGFSTIGDEGGDIQDWIDGFINDTAGMFDSIDIFGGIKKWWENLKTWWNTEVAPIFSNLWQGLVDAASGIDWGKPFRAIGDWWNESVLGWFDGDGSGFTAAISDWWARVSGPLVDAWDRIKESWNKAWEKLKPAFEKLGDAFAGIGDMLREDWEKVWPVIQDLWVKIQPVISMIGKVIGIVAGLIAGFIGGIIIVVSNVVANIIGPIIDFITTIVTWVINMISGIIDFITSVFTGDWKGAWDAILGILTDTWDAIVGIFTSVWDFVVGLVKGLVEGVISWFQWLYDILVGNSIVPDLINAIIDWFGSLPGKLLEFVKQVWNNVVTWFTNTKNDAVQKVKDLWNGVTTWFNTTKNDAVQKVKDLWNGVVTWFNTTKNDAVAKAKETWNNVVTWFGNLKTDAIQKIKDLKTGAIDWFIKTRDEAFQKAIEIRDKVMEPINALKDKFLGAFQTVRDKISGIFDTIKTKVQTGMNGPIRAINKLIEGLNKVADVLPGIDWKISTIPLFAQGGALPTRVGSGFKTSGARAIVGEGNPAHPEYVIPTDPNYRGRALDLFYSLQKQLKVPTDDATTALGGPVQTITSWLGSASNLVSEGAEWMQNVAAGAVSTVFKPFKKIIDDRISQITWDLGRGMVQTGVDKVLGWIGNADDSFRDIEKKVAGGWKRPMDHYSITSRYGPRSMFGNTFHAGTDLANGGGSTIKAASGGQVVRRGFGSVAGRTGLSVVLQHANDIFSYYGHLASAAVKIGQQLITGQKLGIEGATGNVTGPHLHFEIHKGRIGSTMNPETFMRGKGVPLADGGIVRARMGGTLATIGEAGRDEAVIPLPAGWQNMWSSLSGIEKSTRTMTVQYMTVMGNIEAREVIMPVSSVENNYYTFTGDLSFPNITDGSEAEEFLQNLEDLAGK